MDKCCSSEKEKTNLVEANTFCQFHTKIKGFRLQNENLQLCKSGRDMNLIYVSGKSK